MRKIPFWAKLQIYSRLLMRYGSPRHSVQVPPQSRSLPSTLLRLVFRNPHSCSDLRCRPADGGSFTARCDFNHISRNGTAANWSHIGEGRRKEHPVAKQNGQYQPSCLLAHSLINKLSVIVGRCDLWREKTPEESECYQRLMAIRELAKSMAEEITQHQCRFDAIARGAEIINPPSLSELDPAARHD